MTLHTLSFLFFDPVHFNGQYLLFVLIPGLLIGMWAQMRLKAAYARTAKIPASTGMTGAQAAARILLDSGVSNVSVEQTRGWLSDHYDPRNKVLRLSPDVYSGRSIAALGIAAHEAGHALQDAQRYGPLVLRNAAVPAAGIGSNLGVWIVVIGAIMNAWNLAALGVGLFSITVVFQLINLPCEFDASKRARQKLLALGMVTDTEDREVRRVLNAAAWTYVAALISAVMTLLYYLWLIAAHRE